MTSDIIPFVRSVTALRDGEFDVLIVGAGMFGACAAWDAALRGYRVALIERADFCSGVSANSYKIIHGGIRYIQHLDIARVRSSCHERSVLLRIAPHLVSPLPIAIPTYGFGLSGKPILAAGMYLYDSLTADRNRHIEDTSRKIPWSRLMSRREILDKFPGLNPQGLTGAAVFSDAQMYNPPRLILAFLQSASARGATICNYVGLEGYRRSGNGIAAARVRDHLTGESFEIRAKTFLNATGPWTDEILADDPNTRSTLPGIYSRDACFVVKRQFDHDLSVAMMARTKDPDAFLSRPARHVFIVPWRDYSLIGTWHKVVDPVPDAIGLDAAELDSFIDEIRGAYPDLDISRSDVTMCNWGLVPFGEHQGDSRNLSYGKRSIIIDHSQNNGPDNLVSIVGIRVTMGRGDSAIAMRSIGRMLGDRQPPPRTDQIRIHGGEVSSVDRLAAELQHELPTHLHPKVAASLARNYGSVAPQLIANSDPDMLNTVGDSHVLEAEIAHAIDNEMAVTLADVVFRRTDLASGGLPGDTALSRCIDVAAPRLNMSGEEVRQQREQILKRVPGWH